MSRIGKLPIALPKGVTVKHEAGVLTVKGPKGELKRKLHPGVTVELSDAELKIFPANPDAPDAKPLWGLFRSLANNMVTGVTAGFSKTMEVVGVGWRIEEEGKDALKLSLGYSHPTVYKLPVGVSAEVDSKVGRVKLSSVDNELLGETCAKIRAYRPPEPYKGKGIRYQGEKIRRKAGKAGAK
ncbi:MAG: 50S ribosomal protein L6 [Deltaproteobacteria bacterium]|jgi:large subunit ribosomal protein L6|nr:50S ribosomal protein L6 [Deltaproteobacteria bacterium]